MADDGKIQELKAATVVRAAILKVRLASPAEFDDVEANLFTVLEQQTDFLGDMWDKVQEETDHALAAGRTRIEQLQAKEEARVERPRKLIAEFRTLMTAVSDKALRLKTVANLESGGSIAPEEVSETEEVIVEVEAAVKVFAKACADLVATHTAEIKELSTIASIKKEWAELAQQLNVTSQEAEKTVTSAKKAVAEQAMLTMMPELRSKLDDAIGPMDAAKEAAEEAEEAIAPFIKPKKTGLDELSSAANTVEQTIATAVKSLAVARDMMEALQEHAEKASAPAVQTFLQAEAKPYRLLLGRLDQRLDRASNLVRRYRREVFKKDNPDHVAKPSTPAGKATTDPDAVLAVAAETFGKVDKLVELLESMKDMDASELLAAADDAKEVIEVAKVSMVAFTKLVSKHMKVVKTTPLTESCSLTGVKTLRTLKIGEVLQVVEGPISDVKLGLQRVCVRVAGADGVKIMGWATVAGNAGSVFLRPCAAPR